MTDTPPTRILLIIGLCALLGACASATPKTGEGVGKLDAQEKDSPGDLYVALAAEYFRLGQMDAALDRARRALELDNKSGRAHYVMALILQRLGENTLAETQFQQAIELEPQNGDIRNAWGAFLCGLGRYAEADAQFSQTLSNPLYSTPAVTLTNAGLCALSAGDQAKGEAYLRQALTRDPKFGPALYGMAEIDYQRRDYKSARASIERLLQTTQATPQGLLLAVRIETALGNHKQAQIYTQNLRQAFPDAPENMQIKSP